jgi:hypothetical protein
MSPQVSKYLVNKYLEAALKENKLPKTPSETYAEWRLDFVKRNWEIIKKVCERDGFFVV